MLYLKRPSHNVPVRERVRLNTWYDMKRKVRDVQAFASWHANTTRQMRA